MESSLLHSAVWWPVVMTGANKFIWTKTFAFMFISLFYSFFFLLSVHVLSKNYSRSEVVNLITSSVVRDTTRSHWVGINRINQQSRALFAVPFHLPDRLVRRPGNILDQLVSCIPKSIADRRLCGRTVAFFFFCLALSRWKITRCFLFLSIHCSLTALRLMWRIQLFWSIFIFFVNHQNAGNLMKFTEGRQRESNARVWSKPNRSLISLKEVDATDDDDSRVPMSIICFSAIHLECTLRINHKRGVSTIDCVKYNIVCVFVLCCV